MIKHVLTTGFLLQLVTLLHAQVITPFSIRHQVRQKGGIVFLSNTAVTCNGGCTAQNEVPPAGTGYDNNFTAAYVDIDGDAATFSSSSDSLDLPNCSQVTWAGLYWGGEMTNAGANYATRNQVRIKVNSGSYTNLTADALQDNAVGFDTYHCFKDITSAVKAAGSKARFTVANVAVRTGGTNRFGGWTIVVVYKNDAMPMRSLNVFNGLSNVSTGNTNTDISLSGFLTPLSGPVTFEVGAVSYDGDRSLTGDQLLFNGGSGFVNISDAANNSNDVFNSTLSVNGVPKAAPFINPGYRNTLGYDADIFAPNNSAKNYIGNSATSATLRLTTANPGGETYLTQVATIAIDVYEPDLRGAVRVDDLNGGSVVPGDTLLYTVVGKNVGSDPSVNTYITDTLEQNVTFVPGSINITYGPNMGSKTDAASDDQAEYIAASRVVRVRIGTGANGTTGGQVNNSTTGTDSTRFTFRVVTTSDCVMLNCDAIIDNRAFIFGTGNVSGNPMNNQSTAGTFDAALCQLPNNTSTTIVHSCAAPTATSSSPGCAGTEVNLFATSSPLASYAWTGPGSFTASTANATISSLTAAKAGTYTVTITVPGATCSFAPTTAVVVNTPTQTLAGTAGGGVRTQTHTVAANSYYNDASCNLIDRVQASGASPVNGNVTSNVWKETAVPFYAGAPYVARHYEINPTTNPTTATGTVTLYFLQSEFDAFNTAAGTRPKLPTGPADATGISNLRVGKFSGTSSNGSGLVGSYPAGGSAVIDPPDANIVWNSTAGRWEVTFTTTGFGAFIIQTNPSVLPVTWLSFTGDKVNDKVILNWKTAMEANTRSFVIEHSSNGSNFLPVGTVAAVGNSNSPVAYSFVHDSPAPASNYYRLKQIDIDGNSSYSSVIKLASAADNNIVVEINPVVQGRLQVKATQGATVQISNTNGQIVKTLWIAAGRQSIDVTDLSQGIYFLRAGYNTSKFIIQ